MQYKFSIASSFPSEYICLVTVNKQFLAFRVSPSLKDEIQEIAVGEARSVSQICELLLVEGVEAYKKEGSKFMQRLIAKQKLRSK
jgi:hypothetical protein